jgi:hypothetical protein
MTSRRWKKIQLLFDRPKSIPIQPTETKTAAELDALLPAVLERAFRGER